MNKKENKHFRLSIQDVEYLDSIGAKNRTTALEQIIEEHRALTGEKNSSIAKAVVDEFDKRHQNELTRIRLASNFADRNVKVLLEEMNTLMVAMKIHNAFTSLKGKSPVWVECEDEVKRQIEAYKQFNDNYKHKK